MNVCSICLESSESVDGFVSTLGCQHLFHSHCLSRWLEVGRTCPVCRHELRGPNQEELDIENMDDEDFDVLDFTEVIDRLDRIEMGQELMVSIVGSGRSSNLQRVLRQYERMSNLVLITNNYGPINNIERTIPQQRQRFQNPELERQQNISPLIDTYMREHQLPVISYRDISTILEGITDEVGPEDIDFIFTRLGVLRAAHPEWDTTEYRHIYFLANDLYDGSNPMSYIYIQLGVMEHIYGGG